MLMFLCFPLQAFLGNEDVGETLNGVEALIKKHEDFEKSLAAQEEKIKALDESATRLVGSEHYAATEIAKQQIAVSDCWILAAWDSLLFYQALR